MNGRVDTNNPGSRARRAWLVAAWLAAGCGAGGAVAAPSAWTLSAEAWAAPRQAETVLAMPSVAAAVRALLAAPRGQLTLTHPATEEGGLWGSELRDWLVSLGIDSDRIRLQPAMAANKSDNQINLSVSAAPTGGATP